MASAGSGKTRVLTYKIYHRTVVQQAAPNHVLAITFTRKAAANMKSRLAAFGLPKTIAVGTFHAVALSCVKEYYGDKGKTPGIVTDRTSLLGEILTQYPHLDMKSLGQGSSGQSRSNIQKEKGYRFFSRTQYLRALEQEIDLISSNMLSADTDPESVLRQSHNRYIPRRVTAEVFEVYKREKQRKFLLDFGDLIIHLGDLLKCDAKFADLIRWKYRHVFVDEVQDMTLSQLNLLKAILDDNNDLFGVGDTRQSIYEWNGAVKDIEETFKKYFPQTHIMRLSTNYRSTPQIVRAASSLLDGEQIDASQESGPQPTITSYKTGEEEVMGIAKAVRSMKFKANGYQNIAVLVRTNAQCKLVAEALHALGLPVQKNILPSVSLMQDIAGQFPDSAQGLQMMLRDMEMFFAEATKRREPDTDEHIQETDYVREPEYARTDEDVFSFFPHINQDKVKGQKLEIVRYLQVLYNLVKDYTEFEINPNISGFLQWVCLPERNSVANEENGVVQVLTFHRAKGLEWKIVFLPGLEEGLVPIQGAASEDALAEEKRLLYVAMTRATRELYMSHAHKRGDPPSGRIRSRWLTDIEKAMAEQNKADTFAADDIKTMLKATKELLTKSDK